MNAKKSIFKLVLAVTLTGLTIVGCKKEEAPVPTPTTVTQPTPDGSTAQQTQKANDQNNFDNESNRAMDEAINAMQDCSQTRDVQAVCNMTVDTSMASVGKITLTYNGNDCLNLTSRTGSIVIQLPYNGTVTTWTTVGAKAIITFNNYKVTRLSDNKSLTFNGFHSIKNVNGGGIIQLLLGNTIVHQVRANMVITFDDGTTRTWMVAKTRTFTHALGLTTNTIAGDTTFGSYVHAAVWGTNRLGQPFTVDIPTAISYYMSGSVCLYRPMPGVVVSYTTAFTLTTTYGVDIFGNVMTSGCPYGYKFNWVDNNNVAQQVVLPY